MKCARQSIQRAAVTILSFIGFVGAMGVGWEQVAWAEKPFSLEAGSSSKPSEVAEKFMAQGVQATVSGDYQAAVSAFNQAIAIKPDYARAYFGRGFAQSHLDLPKAIADLNRAIQLNPNDALAYLIRGRIRADLAKPQEAIQDLSRAIQLNPDFAPAYYEMGLAHLKLGAFQTAIEDFTRTIQRDEDFAEAYEERGGIYAKLRNHQSAIADFQKAIQLFQAQGVAQKANSLQQRLKILKQRSS